MEGEIKPSPPAVEGEIKPSPPAVINESKKEKLKEQIEKLDSIIGIKEKEVNYLKKTFKINNNKSYIIFPEIKNNRNIEEVIEQFITYNKLPQFEIYKFYESDLSTLKSMYFEYQKLEISLLSLLEKSNYNFSTFDFPDINQNNLKNKTFNSTSIKSSLERIKALQKNISEQNYLLNNFLKIMKKNSSTTKDNSNEILKNSNNIEKMIEGLLDSYKRLLIESQELIKKMSQPGEDIFKSLNSLYVFYLLQQYYFLQSLHSKKITVKNQINNFKGIISKFDQQFLMFKKDFQEGSLKKFYDSKIKYFTDQKEKKTKNLNSLQNNKKSENSKKSSKNNIMSSLDKDIKELQAKRKDLEDYKKKNPDKLITDLQSKLRPLQSELSKTTISKNKKESLESQISQLKSELQDAREESKEYKQDIDKVESDIEKKEVQKKIELKKMSIETDLINYKISISEKQLSQMNSIISDYTAKMGTVKNRMNSQILYDLFKTIFRKEYKTMQLIENTLKAKIDMENKNIFQTWLDRDYLVQNLVLNVGKNKPTSSIFKKVVSTESPTNISTLNKDNFKMILFNYLNNSSQKNGPTHFIHIVNEFLEMVKDPKEPDDNQNFATIFQQQINEEYTTLENTLKSLYEKSEKEEILNVKQNVARNVFSKDDINSMQKFIKSILNTKKEIEEKQKKNSKMNREIMMKTSRTEYIKPYTDFIYLYFTYLIYVIILFMEQIIGIPDSN